MSYVKPGKSLAPKTELNDPVRVEAILSVEAVMHRDWCEDDTCYCRQGA